MAFRVDRAMKIYEDSIEIHIEDLKLLIKVGERAKLKLQDKVFIKIHESIDNIIMEEVYWLIKEVIDEEYEA